MDAIATPLSVSDISAQFAKTSISVRNVKAPNNMNTHSLRSKAQIHSSITVMFNPWNAQDNQAMVSNWNSKRNKSENKNLNWKLQLKLNN